MIIDYDFALIELTAEETIQFKKSGEYRAIVETKARDLSDCCQRTVLITDPTGETIVTISNF
jgi:hypothetical protein